MNASSTAPGMTTDPRTLASVLAFLRRRQALILWPTSVLLLCAIVSCVLATPRYQATTEVQVRKEDGGAFGLENRIRGAGDTDAGDSLDYSMTLHTEAQILRSPALAVAVIQAAHLEPVFFPEKNAAGQKWSFHLPWSKPLESPAVPLSEAPNRRYLAERIFASRLKVLPIAGTRILQISYQDQDPIRAAMVADAITQALANMVFQQHFTATLQGSTWLTKQLDQLRIRTEEAQAKAAALQRGTGVYGNDASRNIVLERLDSLNQTLTAAESNRILKESIDRVAAASSPELISSLSGNSSSGSVASVNTSLTLIQSLRQQQAQVQSALAEDSVRYGPNYPKVAELKAQLDGISKLITAETKRLGERAHTDWLIALREENAARSAFEKQKQLASRQNDSVIKYQLARQEADSSRDLYESLLAKLKQSSLLEGLRANNISVISPAQVPASSHPASPRVLLRLGVALALGLSIGIALAGFRELADDSIHSVSQIESLLGAPLLAVLPAMERKPSRRLLSHVPGLLLSSREDQGRRAARALPIPPRLQLLEQQFSTFSEGLRSLRTALQLSCAEAAPQVILITSCLPGEGKSTLAVNLAALIARGGARVLLVDADLRRPSLYTYCTKDDSSGLAIALSGPAHIHPQVINSSIPTLEILAGSAVPPFPSEMLGSLRMDELVAQWRKIYDVILFDTPPVLPISDAVLLSRFSDANLLLARHRQTSKQALFRGLQALHKNAERRAPIGIVLNGVAQSSGEFYEYFGYRGDIYDPQYA